MEIPREDLKCITIRRKNKKFYIKWKHDRKFLSLKWLKSWMPVNFVG